MLKNFLLLISSLALAGVVYAGEKKKLYKWVDERGNVHYSDEPHPGAEEIKIQEVPTIKMETPKVPKLILPGGSGARSEDKNSRIVYQTVLLTEPSNDGVVRNNAGIVTLSARIEPALAPSHSLRYFLDGRPVGKDPKALSVTVENVDYGEHSASVVVLNKQGKQIQSSESNHFTLLHMINPKLRQNRNNN